MRLAYRTDSANDPPKLSLNDGRRRQIGPDVPLIFSFPTCHFLCTSTLTVSLLLALSLPLYDHQSLHPLRISQLTYSWCKYAKQKIEHRKCLVLFLSVSVGERKLVFLLLLVE